MTTLLDIVEDNHIELHPVMLTHEDGSSEKVYIENTSQKKQRSWVTNVQLTYIVVATLALTLSAYFTYKQLKHIKNG